MRNVASIPADVVSDGLKNGLPVTGAQWRSFAHLCNWLNGRGGTLIPANSYNLSINAGSSQTFRYWIWPRLQSRYHLWIIVLAGGDRTYGTFTPNGGSGIDWWVHGDDATALMFLEDVTESDTAAETYFEFAVTSGAVNTATIQQIACYELPRMDLEVGASTEEFAASLETTSHGNPIQTSDNENNSVEGVYQAEREALVNCRRNGMFHWYQPGGVTVTTADAENIFPYTSSFFGCELAARKLYDGVTHRAVEYKLYAKVDVSDASGYCQMEMESGDTARLYVTSTAPAWVGVTTINVLAESTSSTSLDGIPDKAKFYHAVNSTSATSYTLTVYGISVGEAE